MADAPTSIRRHSANTDWRMYGLQLAVLAAIYIFSGFIGLSLAHYQPNATLIWPPTGLSLAALIVYGPRLWPGVVIGSLALSLLNGSSLPLSLAICTGNTLEAVVGSIVLVRVFDFRPSLDRIRDVMALLLFGGMCATLSSASVGPLALWLLGNIETSQIGPVGLIWWLGDFGGVVVIAPLVLMLYYGNPSWPALFKRVEFWLASISLAGTCLVVFGDTFPQAWSGAIALIPAPFIVWAACRLGTRGAILASSATLLMPTVATGNGTGPFAVPDAQTSMILLWIYRMVVGVTALTMAAALAQRDSAEARRERETAERLRVEREHLLAHERERITREMHDGLGGQLVSVLSMVQRGNASANEVAEAIRRALDDMRIVIDSLEAKETGFTELLGKLRARLEPLLRRNGLRFEWRVEDIPALDSFEPEQSLHALRIIQEAVSNAIQHARASGVWISIAPGGQNDDMIEIEIRDDGVGLTFGNPPGGRGVHNMKVRADALGAELRIEAADPGRRVVLLIPHAQ